MSKNIFYFLTAIVLAISAPFASASTPATVATVPDGMVTLPMLHGVTNYLSLPLTRVSIYTTTVNAVTTNTLSVDDAPAPFTSSLLAPGMPYFVRFLSGNEVGRIMLITGNTSNSLTVDTTDDISGEAVALTTTGFSVQAGDTFEVFPGDTLASVFGDGSSANPLAVTGGASLSNADVVSLYVTASAAAPSYYFNPTAGYWELKGSTANANNTIIYPYSALTVLRLSSHPDTTLTLSGRVTQVAPATKVASHGTVFTSSHFATDITLSQLQFGAKWVQGVTLSTSDSISVWNPILNQFDVFFQEPDSTWRKYPDMKTDQSRYIIPTGSVATIAKKGSLSGAAMFLQSALPYSLE